MFSVVFGLLTFFISSHLHRGRNGTLLKRFLEKCGALKEERRRLWVATLLIFILFLFSEHDRVTFQRFFKAQKKISGISELFFAFYTKNVGLGLRERTFFLRKRFEKKVEKESPLRIRSYENICPNDRRTKKKILFFVSS